MNFSIIKYQLEKLVGELTDFLTVEDIKNVHELINHGECGVALELICSQLFEYEVAISSEMLQRIKEIGIDMSLPEETWNILETK